MLTGLIIFWAFSEFGKFRSMPFMVCWDTLIRALPFSPEELQGYGFRFDASWQTVPYIREDFLDEIFGAYTGEVKERFLVHKGDGRWDLNVLVDTQRKIVGYFSGASDDMSILIRDG